MRRLLKESALVLIISLSLLVAVTALSTYLRHESPDSQLATINLLRRQLPLAQIGKPLGITQPDVTSSQGPILLIITSPVCHYCEMSVSFHQSLLNLGKKLNYTAYLAVPETSETDRYLERFNHVTLTTVDWLKVDRRTRAVPAILITDANHVIMRIWIGLLSNEQQEEVITFLHYPQTQSLPTRTLASGEHLLTAEDIHELRNHNAVTLISVLRRYEYDIEHPPNSINIPLAELNVRARSELNQNSLNILDCTTISEPVCTMAVDHLRSQDFNVAAADLSVAPSSPTTTLPKN